MGRCIWMIVGTLAATSLVGCQALGIDGEDMRLQELIQGTIERASGDRNGPLTASGTIQAEEVRLASELGGRIVEVRVEKGQKVRSGSVLVLLDSTHLLDKLAEAQAAISAAEADLAVVQAGPRDEEIAASRAALALTQAQRDGAREVWQNVLETIEDPQELDARIIEARTQVNLTEQAAILAEAKLAREKLLAQQKKKGTRDRQAADWQVKAAEEALAAAQADQVVAQTTLDWLWYIRDEPLGSLAQANAAEGQVRIAEAEVTVAQAELDDLLAGPMAVEVAVAEGSVRLAQAQAHVLEANLARLTLTSPVDGVVLSQALRAGELAAPAVTILTVADLSRVTLVVYVSVSQVGQVQLGQEARVTVDSFPDKTFTGSVSRIGDEPEFTPRNVATKEERLNTFYAVEIVLENEEGALKPGMPADAAF